MLKTRVIPILLLKNGLINKPVQFGRLRTVSDPIATARVFEERQVDELILLDIAGDESAETSNDDIILDIADELSVPFAVGGGIRTLDAVRRLIRSGVEKVILNTGAVRAPSLIEESAALFGSQCVVVSIDAMLRDDGTYEVFVDNGKTPTGLDPAAWALEAQSAGAGEIIIASIMQDGTMKGYDIVLTRRVTGSVSVPVIASGGAGNENDFVDAVIDGGADAVAASSVFLFRSTTPNMVKETLRRAGIAVRQSYIAGT
ncbi:MAG: imidazole glycerol phosphate synthase subunit HisF [Alphaproteobacteria bacterium]|nr:imidazole glycerol phosphate synthase subunit HisF [Alphaproteobacteria bacterium]